MTRRRTQVLNPHILRSPYFPATERAGAVEYGIYNRMYAPVYANDPREEFRAVLERVTLWDVASQRVVELRGPDALPFANYLCTRDLRRLPLGQCRHTAVCYPDGELICECLVLRPAEEVVWIGHGPVDFLLWAQGIAQHAPFDVSVSQSDVAPLALQGPLALEVMRSVAPEVAELGFFRWGRACIAGVEALVSRSGFSGVFGYEVYPLDTSRALAVWEALADAGVPHGLLVTGVVGPHFERGITDFTFGGGGNLGLNPYELRLGRAVDLHAGPFVGQEALARIHAAGPRRKLLGLLIDDASLPPQETHWPVEDEDGPLGVVEATTYSYIFERYIARAVVDARATPGAQVRIRHPAGQASAELVTLPFMA